MRPIRPPRLGDPVDVAQYRYLKTCDWAIRRYSPVVRRGNQKNTTYDRIEEAAYRRMVGAVAALVLVLALVGCADEEQAPITVLARADVLAELECNFTVPDGRHGCTVSFTIEGRDLTEADFLISHHLGASNDRL